MAGNTRSFKRRLLSSSGFALVGKLSAIGCFILTYGFICQRYSDTEAATYLLLQSLAMLGSLIANWGLGPVIIFRLRNARNSQQEVAGLLRVALGIFVLAAILATALMVSLTWIPQVFKVDLRPYGIYLIFWLLLVGISQLLGEAARAYLVESIIYQQWRIRFAKWILFRNALF